MSTLPFASRTTPATIYVVQDGVFLSMAIDSLYEMVKCKLHGSLNLHELFSKSDQFGTGSPREFGVDVPFQRRLAGEATVGLLAWQLCEWVQGVRGRRGVWVYGG